MSFHPYQIISHSNNCILFLCQVTVENFLRVLTGRLPPSTPRSKRLLSDDRSNILIYLTGNYETNSPSNTLLTCYISSVCGDGALLIIFFVYPLPLSHLPVVCISHNYFKHPLEKGLKFTYCLWFSLYM